jgi:hypothetical protein
MTIDLASPEATEARHTRMAAASKGREEQEAGMRQARALLRLHLKTEVDFVSIMLLGCSRLAEIHKLDSDIQETVHLVDEVCDSITYRYSS